MKNRLAGVGAAVESAVTFALQARVQSTGGDGLSRHLLVGFAIGYLYRHSRTVSGCRRVRDGPVRTLSLAFGWLAVIVAVTRSLDDGSGRHRVGVGVALGSIGYRLARRED